VRLDEKMEIQAIQTQALVDQNRRLMREQLLGEARKNIHTLEGRRIYNQLQNEKRHVQCRLGDVLSKQIAAQLTHDEVGRAFDGRNFITSVEEQTQAEQATKDWDRYAALGRHMKRPKDFGRVVMSNNSSLIHVATSAEFQEDHTQSSSRSLLVYTVDSDFMMRIWDLSCRRPRQSSTASARWTAPGAADLNPTQRT